MATQKMASDIVQLQTDMAILQTEVREFVKNMSLEKEAFGDMVQKAIALSERSSPRTARSATTTGCTSSSSRATKRSSRPTSRSEPHESDADESSSSSSDEESDDADADEGEAGDSMQTE